MNEKDRSLLAEIHRGAKLLFENAEQLYNEAQLLGTSRAFCRAVCLHQISAEECSKIEMLGAATMSIATGNTVDLAKLAQSMRKHKAKNFQLAYTTEFAPAEQEAHDKGDHKAALKIFGEQQNAIHESLNTYKNASLYVDFVNGKFVAPSERITETVAVAMQRLNGERLAISEDYLRLLDRMVTEPDKMAALAENLRRYLESAAPDQLGKALRELLDQTK